MEKYKLPPSFDSLCFSIVTNERTLDLRGEDENICKKWFNAIKYISKKNFNIKGLKNNKELKKDLKRREEVVEDIWKNEIIPNWAIYREFIVDGKSGDNGNKDKEVLMNNVAIRKMSK